MRQRVREWGGLTRCEGGKNQYQDGGVGNIIAEDSRFLGAWQLMPERVRVLDLICDMACHLPSALLLGISYAI